MLLNKLPWEELTRPSIDSRRPGIDHAYVTLPGGRPDAVVIRLNDGRYTIQDSRYAPYRIWYRIDELTAECILIELTRSEHERETP